MSPLQNALQQILDLCDRVTRGGWRISIGRHEDLIIQSKRVNGPGQNVAMMWRSNKCKQENAEFIIVSRRMMRRLARAVREADLNLQVIASKSQEEHTKNRAEFTRRTLAHLVIHAGQDTDTEVEHVRDQDRDGVEPGGSGEDNLC